MLTDDLEVLAGRRAFGADEIATAEALRGEERANDGLRGVANVDVCVRSVGADQDWKPPLDGPSHLHRRSWVAGADHRNQVDHSQRKRLLAVQPPARLVAEVFAKSVVARV
jgi:hypothetical protein